MQEIYTEKQRQKRVWSLKKDEGADWAEIAFGKDNKQAAVRRISDLLKGVPVFFLCLVSSMTSLTGGVMPFGMAYVSGFMMKGKFVLFALCGSALGTLLAEGYNQLYAILLLGAAYYLFRLFKVRLSDLSITVLCGLFAGLVPLGFADSLNQIVMAVITAVLAAAAGRMVLLAVQVNFKERSLISAEEVACLSLLLACPLMGLKGVMIYGFSPVMCAMLFVCLFGGYLGGAGVGATIGAMFGAMAGLTLPIQPHVAAGLALCGLLCGVFSGLGRLASCGALLLAVSLSAALNESWFAPQMFMQAGVAVAAFLLVPKKIMNQALFSLRKELRVKQDNCHIENELRGKLRRRLEEYGELYLSMAQVIARKSSGRQYLAIGHALIAAGEELGRVVEIDNESARLVAEAFDRARLPNLSVRAVKLSGQLEMTIALRRALPQSKKDEMLRVAGAALGMPLRVKPGSLLQEDQLVLCRATQYDVVTGFAQMESVAGQPCGDSYLFREMPGDGYMLALSDGMGHGRHASDESRAAIELLEDYLSAGFSPDSAIMGVNDILLKRVKGDMFATMDLGLVDLSTGRLRIMKIGACDSYIKRGRQLITLKGGALPMGIVEHVAPMEGETQLMDGDSLIFVSDGIQDAMDDGESWLKAKLMAMQLHDPELAARQIVQAAAEMTDEPDDMTILIARVFKR